MDSQDLLSEDDKLLALKIARTALETALSSHRLPDDLELKVPPSGIFREKGAAFVTLKRRGALRGCIGHIEAHEELWKSIRNNAVAAAIHDNRFTPVSPGEVPGLSLEISVLTPPKAIASLEEFVTGRHGIILEAGHNRAVFLPQVAPEQGWDRETTLSYLAMKAGLGPEGWKRPDAVFKVFEAIVFSEE